MHADERLAVLCDGVLYSHPEVTNETKRNETKRSDVSFFGLMFGNKRDDLPRQALDAMMCQDRLGTKV
jgi:hypothetical protein